MRYEFCAPPKKKSIVLIRALKSANRFLLFFDLKRERDLRGRENCELHGKDRTALPSLF